MKTRSTRSSTRFSKLDLSELDAEAQQRLITLVERSVDKVCTVGRTLKAGTKVTLSFDTEA